MTIGCMVICGVVGRAARITDRKMLFLVIFWLLLGVTFCEESHHTTTQVPIEDQDQPQIVVKKLSTVRGSDHTETQDDKTEKQMQERKQLLLTIGISILAVVLVAIGIVVCLCICLSSTTKLSRLPDGVALPSYV